MELLVLTAFGGSHLGECGKHDRQACSPAETGPYDVSPTSAAAGDRFRLVRGFTPDDRFGDVSIASAADTAAMLRREGDRRDRDPQRRESDEGQHAVAAITPVVPARREPEVSVSEIRTEALIRPRGRRPVQQFAGCPVVPPPPPAGVPPS